jgi:hypothetical protein
MANQVIVLRTLRGPHPEENSDGIVEEHEAFASH